MGFMLLQTLQLYAKHVSRASSDRFFPPSPHCAREHMYWHAIRSRDKDTELLHEVLEKLICPYQQAVHSKLDVQLHSVQAFAEE